MIFHRRAARVIACCALLIPAAAGAQAIRGRLVSAVTHQPLSGGQVELRDFAGRLIVTGMSTSSGAFIIQAPGAGRYRVRAIGIGYAPSSFVEINLRATDTLLGDLEISRVASRLPPADDRPYTGPGTRLPDLLATTRPELVREYHFYRLWDQVTERYIAVVAYTLHFRGLVAREIDGLRTAAVLLRLHQYRANALRFSDTTLTLNVQVPADDKTLSSFSGFFVVPSAAEVTGWTLIATQPRRGGADGEDFRPPLPIGPLVVSDLAVGAEGQRLQWNNHGDHIFLAGREPIDAHDAIHLYYQVRSAAIRSNVHADVTVYRAGSSAAATEAVLHLAFEGGLIRGWTRRSAASSCHTWSRGLTASKSRSSTARRERAGSRR